MAGAEGSRSLLLLSDGADTGSDTTLEAVAKSAAEAEVVVDVVSLANAKQADKLAKLAADTNGRVIPADSGALSRVLTAQADALAKQLLVKFELPEGVSGEADIEVTVEGTGTIYADSAFVNVGDRDDVNAGPQPTVVGKPLVSPTMMLVGAGGLFPGCRSAPVAHAVRQRRTKVVGRQATRRLLRRWRRTIWPGECRHTCR
ncbi:hypothetical protein [Nocardioides sp. B-3]|uniref:hypothetical protein n=1 Tax=Nocardioides sp. B-3 TaxID=2895565 RepID=UPI0021535E36|nr:hypothetical protein [Nocardioides sp. B-3]UUZ59711.1 hypothetical protein LP418_00850 [Nocardioides sp. B-3]